MHATTDNFTFDCFVGEEMSRSETWGTHLSSSVFETPCTRLPTAITCLGRGSSKLRFTRWSQAMGSSTLVWSVVVATSLNEAPQRLEATRWPRVKVCQSCPTERPMCVACGRSVWVQATYGRLTGGFQSRSSCARRSRRTGSSGLGVRQRTLHARGRIRAWVRA